MSRQQGEVIKVFVRVRPPISQEVHAENAVKSITQTNICLKSEKVDIKCSYHRVFDETIQQEEIFENIKPLLSDVLSGYNGCIFAYGQTSAGKTHTMIGPNGGSNLMNRSGDWGVLPRAANFLFNTLEENAKDGGLKYTVKASFLEIYNEKLFDLLREINVNDVSASELRIREIPLKAKKNHAASSNSSYSTLNRPCEVFVSGLSEFRVHTAEDVLKILSVGTSNRAMRSTDFNTYSSRSHAVLQLNFEIENTKSYGQTLLYRSKLSLVDLAGSEKMAAMTSDPSIYHFKELTSINQSLSSLGNVISALSNRQRQHIPYRDSKLTRLLQDSLGGNTRTIVIACIAPTVIHAHESATTLQFADRARNVLVKVKANMVIDDKMLLSNAQSEIARLKLLLKQALARLESVGAGVEGATFIAEKETNEEINSVLLENKKLRKENMMLQKMLSEKQAYTSTSSNRHVISRGGDREKKTKSSKKPDWNNRFFDTSSDTEEKKERGGHGHGRPPRREKADLEERSIDSLYASSVSNSVETSPLRTRSSNMGSAFPSPNNNSNANNDYSKKSLLEQKLRTAIDQAKVSDSPGKKPNSSNVSSVSSTVKRSNSESAESLKGGGEESQDDVDVEDDHVVDIKKLKETIDRAKHSNELKKLETSLDVATKNITTKLNEETLQLNSIRETRLELERQLAEMKSAQDDDARGSPSKLTMMNSNQSLSNSYNISEQAELIASTNRSILEKMKQNDESPTTKSSDAQDNEFIPPTSITNDINMETKSLKVVHSSLQSNLNLDEKSKSNTSSTNVSKPTNINTNNVDVKARVVQNQHPPANLKYDKSDVGRKIQLYSFRYNSWEDIDLIDFETSKGMHKCKHVDGSEKWFDLKTKPIRGIDESNNSKS